MSENSSSESAIQSVISSFLSNSIEVKYEDGTKKNFPLNSKVSDILPENSAKKSEIPIVGAYVNAELVGLNVLLLYYLNNSFTNNNN